MGALVAFVLVPTFVSASLLKVREVFGNRILWLVSLATAVIGGVAAFAIERQPSETSAAAITVSIAMSLCLASFIVTIGHARFGRGATLVIASLVSGLSLAPSYMVGCVVADVLPVNGCFF